MKRISSLQSIISDPNYIDVLVERKTDLYEIPLAEGPFKIEANWLLINIIMWNPFIVRGYPIKREYLLYDEDIVKSSLQRIHNNMWFDADLVPGMEADLLKEEMAFCHNAAFNIAFTHLGSYHTSISLYEIEQSMTHPELAQATHLKFIADESINEVEKRLEKESSKLLEVFSDPKYKHLNCLYPYIRLGVASKQQIPQVLLAVGTKTDVNDSMVHLPIEGSYLRGMNNILEAAVDALSAKKSVGYNKSNLPKAQYTNRRAQILASVIRTLHPGDCGTQLTTPFLLTARKAKHAKGMYIKQHGTLIELSSHNLSDYIGKVVNLRSPLTCRHTDGVCEACSGRLARNMHPNMVIGLASVIETISPIGQLLLSNKHFSQTSTVTYNMPQVADLMFRVDRDRIYLRENLIDHQMHLHAVIPFMYFSRITDLSVIDDDAQINDADFSDVRELAIIDDRYDENPLPPTIMLDDNKTSPYFTKEFLLYIKNNQDMLTITESEIVVSLGKWDVHEAIMGYVMENASMPRFVDRITRLFMKDIQDYTSIEDVLKDFTDIIYTKVEPHLYHICVALKACMVVSNNDYRVPCVTDINNVKFRPLLHSIPQRSIGAQLAFERTEGYLQNPRAYTIPKINGPFDAYVGMMDSDYKTSRRGV
jgi:hypothetical protein